MDKFLKFLQSNKAVLLATIMSLATQLWHSVQAFVALEPGDPNWYTYLFGCLFSVSTSFAILLFTVRGRVRWAYFFLAVEVFINVIHYGIMDMSAGPVLFSTLFMCIIVPVTISVYSAEIDPTEETEPSDALVEAFQPEVQRGSIEWANDKKSEVKFTPDKKGKMIIVDQSEYDGEPNIQMISKLDDQGFLNEVNNLIGFDITNPKDKSGDVPEDKKKELRKLWAQRKNKNAEEIKAEMRSILNSKNGKPLFS